MLSEISMKNIPIIKNNLNMNDLKIERLPDLLKEKKFDSNSFLSNFYIQSMSFMIYFIDIPEFPLMITLPKNTTFSSLASMPFVHLINKTFKFQRAFVASNYALKIQVKGLSNEVIPYIDELDKLNKIDPILKKLFKRNVDENVCKESIGAYRINNEISRLHEKVLLSNFQKYLLWECVNNNGLYGFPISNLTINDIKDKSFLEFTRIFDNIYFVGSGIPWKSTHMLITNPSDDIDLNTIKPF